MFFGIVVYNPLLILNIFFSSNNLRKCQDNIFLESSIFPERYSDKSFVLNSLLVFAKSTMILLTFILLSLMVRCKDSQILAIKQIYCQNLTYYYTVFRYQPSRFRISSSIIGCGQEKFPISKPMAGYFSFGKRQMKWYGSEKGGRSQFYTNMLEMLIFYFILFFHYG